MPYPAKTTTNFYVWNPQITQVHTDLGGQNELTETFIVEKRGSTTSSHTEIKFDRADFLLLVDQVVLPDIGMSYNTWNPQATNTGSWHKYARCRGYNLTPLPDGRLQVVTAWSTYYTANPTSVVAHTPFVMLPSSIESQSGTRITELFRTGWTTPPLATVDVSVSDIGGTSTQNTKGTPSNVSVTKVRLRLIKDATVEDMGGALIYFTLNMVGARHKDPVSASAFLGFPTGALYCEGINMVKLEGEFYEVIADFVYDQYYEHDQLPLIDPEGDPIPNAAGNNWQDVRWSRVERPDFDFNEIFYNTLSPVVKNTNTQAHVEKGYWI